jgi:ribosomal protein L13
MLPHQKARGIEALKRLRIYTGTIENVEFKTYPEASFKGSKRFIELGALCKKLGARW